MILPTAQGLFLCGACVLHEHGTQTISVSTRFLNSSSCRCSSSFRVLANRLLASASTFSTRSRYACTLVSCTTGAESAQENASVTPVASSSKPQTHLKARCPCCRAQGGALQLTEIRPKGHASFQRQQRSQPLYTIQVWSQRAHFIGQQLIEIKETVPMLKKAAIKSQYLSWNATPRTWVFNYHDFHEQLVRGPNVPLSAAADCKRFPV